MAVIQTPKGRVIGLVVNDRQPKTKTVDNAEAKVVEEQPKRGRPKKQ